MIVGSIILGMIPGLIWLFFYVREDVHPEPKRLIVLTYVTGAAFAFLALVFEVALKSAGVVNFDGLTLPGVVLLAFIEELFKFAGAYIAIHNNPEFDEPIDAMVYTVVAALGFATVENIGAVGNYAVGAASVINGAFETTSLRFIGATLLHALTSGVVGYYWASGLRRLEDGLHLMGGLILATALHAVFNYLIISYGNLVYTVLFVVTLGFFVLRDFEKLRDQSI